MNPLSLLLSLNMMKNYVSIVDNPLVIQSFVLFVGKTKKMNEEKVS